MFSLLRPIQCCIARGLPALILLFAGTAGAQQRTIDSLGRELKSAKGDSAVTSILNKLAKLYYGQNDYGRSLHCAEKAFSLAEASGNIKQKADALREMAMNNSFKGNNTLALKQREEELRIRLMVNDRFQIAEAYNGVGVVKNNQGDYDEALKYYLKALQIQEELKDSVGMANSYNNIGLVYDYLDDPAEAIRYLQLALKINKARGDERKTILVTGNLAMIYTYNNEFGKAAEYFEAARNYFQKTGNKLELARTYGNLGLFYEYQEMYAESVKYYEIALKLQDELGDRRGLCITGSSLGQIYFEQGNRTKAAEILRRGLQTATQIGFIEYMREFHYQLSVLDSAAGNHASSYGHYKLFIAYNDSIHNEASSRSAVNHQMNFEYEKKERAMRIEHEKKAALLEAEHRKRNTLIAGTGFALVMMIVFSFIAHSNYRRKKRVSEKLILQKEVIEHKQNEILDSIRYAKRIQNAMMPSEEYLRKLLKKS